MDQPAAKPAVLGNAAVQLLIGVACMSCVANLQYGWTFFVDPIDAKFHWGRIDIQFAFTLFVFVETWLVPIEGYLVDRLGPSIVVLGGAVLVGGAWALNSVADSIPLLYTGAIIGGIGTGAVYGTCVGNALKWFPNHRGVAAGFTAAGFGAGAALTTGPIAAMIKSDGYQHAFLVFGLIQGGIVLVLSFFLRKAPPMATAPRRKSRVSAIDYTPRQVLANPVFWVMYAMFVCVAVGGLTLTASVAPIAFDMKIDQLPVTVLWLSGTAAVVAVKFDRVFDGIGRPLFGWLSDVIGRENTMAIAFLVGAGCLFYLAHAEITPVSYVIVTALYFMVFGEIYSLFPATQGDTFGSKFAASNAGMLYTAKGTAVLLVPLATSIAKSSGWPVVFTLCMVLNVIAGLAALVILKPLRARHFAEVRSRSAATPSPTYQVAEDAQ